MLTLDAISAILHSGRQQFTGRLEIQSPERDVWNLYYYLGRIIWCAGGQHPQRRWRRALVSTVSKRALGQFESDRPHNDPLRDYATLIQAYKKQQLSREEVQQIISQCVNEVLFDILQSSQASVLTGTTHPETNLPKPVVLLKTEAVFSKAERLWQRWCEAELAAYSPNAAPVVSNRALLETTASEKVYRKLMMLTNSRNTLRDLSVVLKQDIVRLTQSLAPRLQSGALELAPLADLRQNRSSDSDRPENPDTSDENSPLIACIDDSPQNCKILENILRQGGYRVYSVTEPLEAIPQLISRKPDIIFLDLVMPIVNGYEVCAQIQRVSQLQDIPVVFLTSQDGLLDRMRAKLVRAAGFLSKPIDPDAVLETIDRLMDRKALQN
jgi:chemotaxis family two-component system response regulator PixG